MPVLLQICVVIVTLALGAIAIVTVRTMIRFERAADEVSQTAEMLQKSIAQMQNVTHEIHEVVASVADIAPRLRRTAARFEDLGERTARLSAAVLEEVEAPVRTAVAVARGVRIGSRILFDRLAHRIASHRSPTNGGI